MESWTREQVHSCSCAALSYLHTHCPCQACKNKAVSRAIEYRHWKESVLMDRFQESSTSTCMCAGNYVSAYTWPLLLAQAAQAYLYRLIGYIVS